MSFDPILEVIDLEVRLRLYSSTFEVLKKVSFNLYPGQTLALVGESGSGKSMTALSLMGIAPSPPVLAPKGSALYRGKNLFTLSSQKLRQLRGNQLAMIFQDPSNALNPVMTIGDQLIEICKTHLQMDDEEGYSKSIEALTSVGIAKSYERMDDYPHQLSGGLRQRVMIAMALLPSPDILIADEPTTALDVTIQAQVIELFKTIQKERQMAILLITHDMGVVAELADDVAVMYAGEIVEKADAVTIFDNPAHPYTKGLFASLNRFLDKGSLTTIKGSVPSLHHIPKGCPFHPRCPDAMKKCCHDDVPNFKIADLSPHFAKCWLYES
jgi:peptide/nickel transport system ATP-binding protein